VGPAALHTRRHAGTPITLRTTKHQFTLTPTRSDEHAYPNESGSIELLVGVVNTTFVVPDAEITLCHGEARALTEALLIAYLTAATPQLADARARLGRRYPHRAPPASPPTWPGFPSRGPA
jgi:hypothetical protein